MPGRPGRQDSVDLNRRALKQLAEKIRQQNENIKRMQDEGRITQEQFGELVQKQQIALQEYKEAKRQYEESLKATRRASASSYQASLRQQEEKTRRLVSMAPIPPTEIPGRATTTATQRPVARELSKTQIEQVQKFKQEAQRNLVLSKQTLDVAKAYRENSVAIIQETKKYNDNLAKASVAERQTINVAIKNNLELIKKNIEYIEKLEEYRKNLRLLFKANFSYAQSLEKGDLSSQEKRRNLEEITRLEGVCRGSRVSVDGNHEKASQKAAESSARAASIIQRIENPVAQEEPRAGRLTRIAQFVSRPFRRGRRNQVDITPNAESDPDLIAETKRGNIAELRECLAKLKEFKKTFEAIDSRSQSRSSSVSGQGRWASSRNPSTSVQATGGAIIGPAQSKGRET